MGPTFVGHGGVDVLDSPMGPLGLLGLTSQFIQFTLFSNCSRPITLPWCILVGDLDTTPTRDLIKENICFDLYKFDLTKVSYIQAIIIWVYQRESVCVCYFMDWKISWYIYFGFPQNFDHTIGFVYIIYLYIYFYL